MLLTRRVPIIALLATSGCLAAPEAELLTSFDRPATTGFVEVLDRATGGRCRAVLVAPRVALTATTCLGSTTADRLWVLPQGEERLPAGVEWQYHRGTAEEPFAGARLEDVEALLLTSTLPDEPLAIGPVDEARRGFVGVDAGGGQVPLWDTVVAADRLTFTDCEQRLAAGDPIRQGDALVAIVSRRDESCTARATTVAWRGPVLSALSSAEGHTSRTSQWHAVTDGLIDTRTEVTVLATPERALAALETSWQRWWPDGTITNHVVAPDGAVSFELSPVRGLPVHVSVRMGPATSTRSLDGHPMIVAPVTLAGSFVGPARFEVEDIGTPDEPRSVVRSVWDHVAPTGAFALAAGGTAQLHMWAEGGKLPGRRTGLPGLIDYLERWQDLVE